jgi:hypothetical protein
MSTKEIIGLLLIIVGVVIIPLYWIVTHNLLLLALAGVLLFVGPILFYAERFTRKEDEQLKALGIIRESNYISGDFNNSTGSGWESSSGSHDTSCDAGGSGGCDG